MGTVEETAHHDTASQRYPMKMIKILYKYGALLILTYLILTFIVSIWSLLVIFSIAQINTFYYNFRNIIFVIGLIILILNLILLAEKQQVRVLVLLGMEMVIYV